MKLLIASDIHGSALYCDKLLGRTKGKKQTGSFYWEMFLYHGPRNDLPAEYNPKKVIAMLNPIANEILCVRGIATAR